MNETYRYYTKLLAGICILIGSFLEIEHLFTFGYLEFEPIGHETYGLAFILFGSLLGYLNYRSRPK